MSDEGYQNLDGRLIGQEDANPDFFHKGEVNIDGDVRRKVIIQRNNKVPVLEEDNIFHIYEKVRIYEENKMSIQT